MKPKKIAQTLLGGVLFIAGAVASPGIPDLEVIGALLIAEALE